MALRTKAARVAAAVVATGVLLAIGLQASSSYAETEPRRGPAADLAAPAPAMLAAMQRDLGLTPAQARARLDRERAAVPVAERLRADLGTRFAGAWFSPAGDELVVATTDTRDAAAIKAAGAVPRTVAWTHAALDAIKVKLDGLPTPKGVFSWYVDVEANSVVVRARPEAAEAAKAFAAAAGPAAPVRVEIADVRFAPTVDARGGDTFFTDAGCSIGFGVVGGFVTAGHCGTTGQPTSAWDWSAQGVVAGSVYPGSDMAWVRTNAQSPPRPWIKNGNGGSLRIAGQRVVPANSVVCRSGGRTGWHCGRVKALNTSLDAGDGTVRGLTKTDVCAEGGDSGGPYVWNTRALGVASAARSWPNSDCPTGGLIVDDESYFQPIGPILNRFGLTLLIAPGTISALSCNGLRISFTCTLSYNGTDPVRIRWIDDDRPRPDWDNLTTVRGSCTRGSIRTLRVSVIHADGTDLASDSARCEGNQ